MLLLPILLNIVFIRFHMADELEYLAEISDVTASAGAGARHLGDDEDFEQQLGSPVQVCNARSAASLPIMPLEFSSVHFGTIHMSLVATIVSTFLSFSCNMFIHKYSYSSGNCVLLAGDRRAGDDRHVSDSQKNIIKNVSSLQHNINMHIVIVSSTTSRSSASCRSPVRSLTHTHTFGCFPSNLFYSIIYEKMIYAYLFWFNLDSTGPIASPRIASHRITSLFSMLFVFVRVGDDRSGRKVVVIASCRLPSADQINHQRLLACA